MKDIKEDYSDPINPLADVQPDSQKRIAEIQVMVTRLHNVFGGSSWVRTARKELIEELGNEAEMLYKRTAKAEAFNVAAGATEWELCQDQPSTLDVMVCEKHQQSNQETRCKDCLSEQDARVIELEAVIKRAGWVPCDGPAKWMPNYKSPQAKRTGRLHKREAELEAVVNRLHNHIDNLETTILKAKVVLGEEKNE